MCTTCVPIYQFHYKIRGKELNFEHIHAFSTPHLGWGAAMPSVRTSSPCAKPLLPAPLGDTEAFLDQPGDVLFPSYLGSTPLFPPKWACLKPPTQEDVQEGTSLDV